MRLNKNSPNREDELRMENQLLRAKIELLSGHDFIPGFKSPDLPLHIENRFLSQILKMEEAKNKANDVTVFELLGNPVFKKENELSDDEIEQETARVHAELATKNILCDSICDVDPRVFYKFLTEELMEQQVADIVIPGMTCCFTYEEFHPNHEHDIKNRIIDFVRDFEHHNSERLRDTFSCKSVTNINDLLLFRDSFSKIIDLEFDSLKIEICDDQATAVFNLAFKGIVSRGQEPIEYPGEGKLSLEYSDIFWDITHVSLPGM